MGTPIVRIRILGDLDVRIGDEPLPPLESGRAESLLAYLLVHRGRKVARGQLAFRLWPDSTEAQARTNLRHVLHTLRRALPVLERCFDVTAQTLEWRADGPYWLDLEAFEAALDRGDWHAAVDLYRGDLLEGSYDEWVLEERQQLRDRYLDALARLVETERDDDATAYAERLVREDPLREDACRALMRLHDARGDRARALRAYHACAEALERDLGIEPSAETRAAYEALLPDAPHASTPERPALVGRADERARLTALWREAAAGRAQLVLVTGEPGVGKTRLVEDLRAWCAHRGATTAEARSYAAEGALAYGPVATWLRADALAARRVRLDRGRLSELARILPEISGLPEPKPLPEAEQRQRLFDALAHALLAPSTPTLLVADDLPWADRETLQFLHYLVRSRLDAPLLIVATARREDMGALHELVTALAALERVTEIELNRLSERETALLAKRFRELEPADVARLFAETEGNPLFVVEALRAGWPAQALTPRVQAVIESRLAALSEPARELAGIAAAIGREFTYSVLAATSEIDVSALDELWRRRIVRDRGPAGYDFSHDKIREVAYAGLGPAARREIHRRVARALEALRPDEPGQIAHHHDRAGEPDEAIEWYTRAAGRAQRMHAPHEAIRLLDRALELASDRERELELITALTPIVANVEGFGSARVASLQERAFELTEALGSEPAPPLLRSRALLSLSKSDFATARRCGDELRRRGEQHDDNVLVVESDYVLGIVAFWEGELQAARRHFEAAVAGYREEDRATHLYEFGFDPKVVSMSRLANTLAFLGDADAARSTRRHALAVAQETGHVASTATALVFAALLAVDLGDLDDVRAHTAALQALPADQPVRAANTTAEALAGYVDVLDGRVAEGIARAQRAAEDEGDHAPGHRASVARILLAACVAAGDAEAGVAAADRLLQAGAGAALWADEARRRRAELSRNARGTPARA
ncbi:MAG TPA: AAA family ATPase [Solirubrobacter sp.]|nr:AAA family ATPase [Solirubrobacter sp.]